MSAKSSADLLTWRDQPHPADLGGRDSSGQEVSGCWFVVRKRARANCGRSGCGIRCFTGADGAIRLLNFVASIVADGLAKSGIGNCESSTPFATEHGLSLTGSCRSGRRLGSMGVEARVGRRQAAVAVLRNRQVGCAINNLASTQSHARACGMTALFTARNQIRRAATHSLSPRH